ncbi:MAG: hypothetical protein H6739_33870 [Alphaproteobacteria bacterium]|nr:hypothetical protein [Alphaproteobacteria bacterium]
MRRSLLSALTVGVVGMVLSALAPTTVYAQSDEDDPFDFEDDFDDDDDDDEDKDDTPERLNEADEEIDLFGEEEINEEDFGPSEGEGLKFDDELEELGEDEIGGEGVDNVAIYREYRDSMDDLGPEEELLSWERYLDKYPNSLFKDRIDQRMEELTTELYDERLDGDRDGYTDNKDREIYLAHPLLLENIDPRSRLRVNAGIGLGGYAVGLVDFEYQLLRQWSAHAGLQRRYTGGSFEVGTRYALVKSARLNTIVTGTLDFRYNLNPGFPGVRPMVAAGKRFDVLDGLDIQAQAGLDLELPVRSSNNQSGRAFGMRYVGGVNGTIHLSEVVAFFAEGSFNMKYIGWEDGGTFHFDVLTFGLKVSPKKAPVWIAGHANLPFYYNYWGYHFGSVQGDVLLYLDDYLPNIDER